MVSITALWLPILVSSVIVFLAGYVMNMVLPHHRTDFARLPDEGAFLDAVRSQGAAQGQYSFPHASTAAAMNDPAYQEKVNAGPVGILAIGPNGQRMAKQLGLHFVYVLVISFLAGYMGSATLPAGVDYLKVFQVVGTAAGMAYSGALFLNAIWFHMTWASTWKHAIDGIIYGFLTAGVFGWLWP